MADLDQQLCQHRGGCHCGGVQFAIDAPKTITTQSCNCSMCQMTGFLHLIVPARQFRLLSDPDQVTEYRFNTGTAKHLFCKECGVKSYYVPRSNPTGFSVNVRCLDMSTIDDVIIEPFDGQNWEQNATELKHLSD